MIFEGYEVYEVKARLRSGGPGTKAMIAKISKETKRSHKFNVEKKSDYRISPQAVYLFELIQIYKIYSKKATGKIADASDNLSEISYPKIW